MADAKIKIKAKDETSKAFKSAQDGLKKIGDYAGSTQTQIAGLLGAGGFAALIQMQLNTAASAKKLGDAIGVNVEDLSAWQYAARSTNVEGEKMGDILKDVAEKIGDAFTSGGGEAIDVLDRLNISVDEMVKLTPDQQLLKIAGALDQVATKNEKVYLLESLASDASQLLPLLEDNAAGFREMRAEAEQLGAIITNETAVAAQQYALNLEKLKASGNSLALELGNKALPALNSITSAMVEAAKDSGILTALWVGLGGAASELLGLEGSVSDQEKKAADAHARAAGAVATQKLWIKDLNAEQGRLKQQIDEVTAGLTHLRNNGIKPGEAAYEQYSNRIQELDKQYADNEARIKQHTESLKIANAQAEKLNRNTQPSVAPQKQQPITGTGPSAEEKKRQEELAKTRKKQQEKYAEIIESHAGEMELTYIHEAEKRAFLDSALANDAITAQQHETALTLIAKDGADARKELTEKERQHRLSVYQGMMGNLTALMASGSKTQFMIGKRAAQTNALLSAKESVVHAYKEGTKVGGPYLGAAYAITAGIATAAQIADLEATTFSGGGSISPSGGGGVSAGGGQPPVAPVPPALSQPQQSSNMQVQVVINGSLVGDDGLRQLTEDHIVPAIQDLTNNSDITLFDKNSRQAQELTA